MLSIRKVKLHGMQDSRWVTKDKAVQYKGLIKLFTRDNKIMQIDTTLHNKRQERLLRTIHKDIVRDRKNLTNTIRGDRQQIRNVFQDHKELQLAYQELQVLDIIEKIYQENFNKRKKLDILYYRKRTRTTKLVSSKLRVAVLEDRLRFEGPGTLPFEIHAKIVTAQVRDAILKQDAAIKVGDIYRHILNTMKWDAIYFDAVLNALKSDTRYQGRCMYNAIELGQLATEYLDDRKKEYKRLEAVVKADLVHRVEDLQGLTCEVNEHNEKIKRYTRKDSDITLPAVNLNTNTDTQANVQFVCSMLDVLKNAFYIVDYHELYSCIQGQFQQTERLKELARTYLNQRDTLQNRISHANSMHDSLYFTMVDTTFEYINTKKSLKDEMQHQIDKANDNKHRKKRLCSLLVTIKSSLQHLQEYCKVMKGPHERRGSKQSEELGMKDIINIKSNVLELIDILVPKLTLLVANEFSIKSEFERDMAMIKFQKLISQRTKSTLLPVEQNLDMSLVGDDVILEDPLVPNRSEIKYRSKQIVQANTKSDDDFQTAINQFDFKKSKPKI